MKTFSQSMAVATMGLMLTGAVVLPITPAWAASDSAVSAAQTPTEHATEAAIYDNKARDLDVEADRHARMAANYRTMIGGKFEASMRSLASHCERLAQSYRKSASEAREIAKSHRQMASKG